MRKQVMACIALLCLVSASIMGIKTNWGFKPVILADEVGLTEVMAEVEVIASVETGNLSSIMSYGGNDASTNQRSSSQLSLLNMMSVEDTLIEDELESQTLTDTFESVEVESVMIMSVPEETDTIEPKIEVILLEPSESQQTSSELILTEDIATISVPAKYTENPFEKSNITAEQFNTMLENTGLAGCGESYYNMEQTYNVNGLFAVGVAMLESGRGQHLANTYNYYGMKGNNGWMSFESADANIMYFGKLMASKLYNKKTSIPSIGRTYCPGTSDSWASQVKTLMQEFYTIIE